MSYNPNTVADLVNWILFGTEHGVVSAKHIAEARDELNQISREHGGISTLLELLNRFELERVKTGPVHERYVFIQTADGFEFMTNLRLPEGEMRFRRVIMPAPDFDPAPTRYKPLPTREYEYVGVKYREHGDAFVVRVFREVRP